MTTFEYSSTTSTIDCAVPINPATDTIHSNTSITVQIDETTRIHGKNCRALQLYHDVDKSLRNQLITSTPIIFLQELQDPILGIGQVNFLHMLMQKKQNLRQVTQSEIDHNDQNMSRAWNPPTPIKDLFKKIRVGHKIATEGVDAP